MTEEKESIIDEPVPYKIDSISKNQLYEVKIKSIYDPSKFWIIIYFRELALFTDYLTSFYGAERSRLAIPRVKMRKGMTCIVCRNSKYHRAVIQPVLVSDLDKLRVFLVDYGLTINVQADNIYYLTNKHLLVPRFAIRASLAYISPPESVWSLKDLKEFCKLVAEEKLFVNVLEIDSSLKILHVNIFRIVGNSFESVNNTMVETNLARMSCAIPKNSDAKSDKYKSKVKFMHLFPLFRALEQGTVPCSLWEQNLLKCVPKDVLYPAYFEYNYVHTNGIPYTKVLDTNEPDFVVL